MAGEDIIMLSRRELKRVHIIQKVLDGELKQVEAGGILLISDRQIRRIIKRVRREGEAGVIHKGRGKLSGRQLPKKIKKKVIKLCRERYKGFGPTLATEKLIEIEGIKISKETLRKWLIADGLWESRRKRKFHRQWRQRKECFGEMVQMDGSHHDWLEGRGPELVLMGYIDDATNNVFGRFYDYEGTMPAMESFKLYSEKYGLPQSIYVDKHSTYKSSKRLTVEEELEGMEESMSQFERALEELGVEVIHAHSPQAKGRVERLFGTLQDRLIKEMRLRGVNTKDGANKFLLEYLPVFNKRFRVCPANNTDVHVKVSKQFDIDKYLCIKTERTARNDNTITHNGRLYQIEANAKGKRVMVEERIDGSLHIMSNGLALRYREIFEIPKKEVEVKRVFKERKSYKPPKDHPWRKFRLGRQTNNHEQKENVAVI